MARSCSSQRTGARKGSLCCYCYCCWRDMLHGSGDGDDNLYSDDS